MGARHGRERAGENGFAGELYALYVLEGAQRQGHGRALVRTVAGALHEMELPDMIVWVLRDNAGARHFYISNLPIGRAQRVLTEILEKVEQPI